jgi:hypothetical protein
LAVVRSCGGWQDAERTRVAVGKAIRCALTRITAADAVIGGGDPGTLSL